jgi:hypothetical protein
MIAIRRKFVSRLSKTAAIVGAMALIGLLGLSDRTSLTIAADLPLVSRDSKTDNLGAPASKVDANPRLERFAKGRNATCTAWTDGCRSCGKGPDGIFCSNVGIACQASEPHCTRP